MRDSGFVGRLAGVCIAALCSSTAVNATTLVPGEVLFFPSGPFAPSTNSITDLILDGGRIVMSDPVRFVPGSAIPNVLNIVGPAELRSGFIYNSSAEVARIVFNNGATWTGNNGSQPFAADELRIESSPFDAGPMEVVIKSGTTFNQAGFGQFMLGGNAILVNEGTYSIETLRGIGRAFGPPNSAYIKNAAGAVFVKNAGLASVASVIDVPLNNNGTVTTGLGLTLTLASGGVHQGGLFHVVPSGEIQLGGNHIFDVGGTATTQGGDLRLLAGANLDVRGVWEQKGDFTNHPTSTITLAETGVIRNSGLMTLAANPVFGVPSVVAQGKIVNLVGGTINVYGHITPGATRGVDIDNEGRFVIQGTGLDSAVVDMRSFRNLAGELVVNGVLFNQRFGPPTLPPTPAGILEVLGGVLSGNGIINGDTFVGGGPGVASFRPGRSPGTMTINGDFSLLPGGVLELEVERNALTGEVMFDQVFANNFFLNGKVSLVVGSGVEESDVTGLQFLTCNGPCSFSYGSNFSFDFPNRPGSSLQIGENGLQITTLAPVPEPGSYLMLLAGLGLLGFAAKRRASHAANGAAVG